MDRYEMFVLVVALLNGAASSGAVPIETAVEAPGPTGALRGSMLSPSTGPGAGGMVAAPYRLLAEAFAAWAVTTVRIDKRGLAGSAGATADGNAVTIDDHVSDVHAWTAVIRQLTSTHCIRLLGHSEGGLIALVAAKNQGDVCGLIVVATAGRPMGELLWGQLKANPATRRPLRRSARGCSPGEYRGRDESGNAIPRAAL